MEIRPATREDLIAFWPDSGYFKDVESPQVFCGIVDGIVVALSGLVPDNRTFGTIFEDESPPVGFLELKPGTPPLGAKAVRAIRRFLIERGLPVIVQRDDREPHSARLLKVLGFTPTAEIRRDLLAGNIPLRIWIWQPSPSSPQ